MHIRRLCVYLQYINKHKNSETMKAQMTKKFAEQAELELNNYIYECIESGGLDNNWEDARCEVEEDRVEISAGGDTRHSIYYNVNNSICFDKGMKLTIVDTSC